MPVTCPASISRRVLMMLAAVCSTLSISTTTHAGAPVGINMAPVYFHNTEWVFVDVMKMSSGWVPQYASGGPWDTGEHLAETSDGWPLLAPGQAAACVMFVDLNGKYPGGNYVCRYDGSGTIEFGGDASIVSQTPGRIVVNVQPSNSGIVLRVTASNSGNPVRNIRMIMPGFEGTYQTKPFHPTFLDRLSNYKSLRFMDWGRMNATSHVHWSDRTKANDRTQASGDGVAYEYMIQLCNTLGTDPWVCMPHTASDDYVRQCARLFRDHLNPALSVYVEHSNEVWNGSYPQATHAQQRGLEMGLSGDPYLAGARYHSVRSVQIFNIWHQEFGSQKHRVQRVLAAQHDNPWIGRQILDFQNAYQHADCVAVAPYFGYYLGLPGQANQTAGMSVEAILAAAESDMMGNRRNLTIECANDAAARGLKLIAYEGGQHLVGVGSAMNDWTLNNKFFAANRHPKMGELYQQDLNVWAEAGGDLFCEYSSVGRYTEWGSWGTYEWQNQPIASAPKFAAIQDYIASGGGEPHKIRQYEGTMAGERLGFNVAPAGDVNADGKVDILISGSRADIAAPDGGHVLVYSGATGDMLFYKVGHQPGEQFGYSAVAAGDVNADGHGDIIVGAWGNNQNGADAGKVYVYSGKTSSLLYSIAGVGADHRFGFSVARLGDVNGDSRSDFAVGAWGFNNDTGRVYIYSGANGSLIRTLTGMTSGERLGYSVGGPGDVTGDNVPDVLAGAPWGRNPANVTTGRAYVFHGNSGGLYHTRYGNAVKERFGRSVAGLGDVNGDGRADYAVGSFKSNEGGFHSGKACIYSGKGPLLFAQTGAGQGHRYGLSISGIGDINFDGRADFAIGAHKAGGSGRVYIYAGGSYNTLAVYRGDFVGDKFGHNINSLGDINNDGRPDFLVGAWGNSSGAFHAGRAYVISGLITQQSEELPLAGDQDEQWLQFVTAPPENPGVASAEGAMATAESGGPSPGATGGANDGGSGGAAGGTAGVDGPQQTDSPADDDASGDEATHLAATTTITAPHAELEALTLSLLATQAAEHGFAQVEQAMRGDASAVLRNSAYLSLFDAGGIVDVKGDYVQTPRGALAVHLAGLGASDHEHLHLGGSAQLGGSLLLTVDASAELAVGDSFEVLTAGSVTGAFDYVIAPVTENGLTFTVHVQDDRVVVEVVDATSHPGAVDLATWLPWYSEAHESSETDAESSAPRIPGWLEHALWNVLIADADF